MEVCRQDLLKRLALIKGPVARPTVQTMDMGLEYVVMSSEGGDRVLGRYGAWPLFGPFRLSSDDLDSLRQSSDQRDSNNPFPGTGLEYVWDEIVDMLDYHEASDEERETFLWGFVAAVLDEQLCPGERFYVYFDKYERDAPLLFNSRNELIDYFMSLQQLSPWEEMETKWLELFVYYLDECDEVEVCGPFIEETET